MGEKRRIQENLPNLIFRNWIKADFNSKWGIFRSQVKNFDVEKKKSKIFFLSPVKAFMLKQRFLTPWFNMSKNKFLLLLCERCGQVCRIVWNPAMKKCARKASSDWAATKPAELLQQRNLEIGSSSNNELCQSRQSERDRERELKHRVWVWSWNQTGM